MPLRRCPVWYRGAAAVALSLGIAWRSQAQGVTHSAAPWRTIATPDFVFHTTAALEPWTRHVASRMQSYAGAVNAFVGHDPGVRVTVVVHDPSAEANGFAIPVLGRPLIVLWPTPPAPSLTFGEHRDWGEILAIHEYAHIAHLTYPSRNARERLLWSLLPARIGPVARKAPAWAFEGLATLVEGRLTGSGRPHSAGRAAVLRQWALEGKLPPYAALGRGDTFLGGSLRYLVGSAFLEWLVERKGEASLEHVWRRVSARQMRSFSSAFAGVFGAAPEELYGRFVVDVTERALRARDTILARGAVQGELVQRLAFGTGEPAVSGAGEYVALALRTPNEPSRLVVWRTGPAGIDSALLRRRARALRRDPLDVAPFDSFPLPRRALATLRAAAGSGHNHPRWMPNGEELLVSRQVPLGDGSGATRPDLFLWRWKTGALRRVTHGAGVSYADPAPDGRRAAGVRCDAGRCDLVLVDLERGTWSELRAGSFTTTWHRPRWSPDGRRVAASLHRDGRWSAAVVDVATRAVTLVGLDAVSRHSPTWLPDGKRVVVVSDRNGVPNLEELDVDGGGAGRHLTSVVGAVAAPEVSASDTTVWYLDLHARGLDLRRLRPRATALDPPFLGGSLAPAAPARALGGSTFDSTVVTSRPYRFAERIWRHYPGFGGGADGAYGLLAIASYDPAGKVAVLAQGATGSANAWRGGSLGVATRALPLGVWQLNAVRAQDAAERLSGAALSLERKIDSGIHTWNFFAALGGGRAEPRGGTGSLGRVAGVGELAYTWRRSHSVARRLEATTLFSAGRAAGSDVRRAASSLGATLAAGPLHLQLRAAGGRLALARGDSGRDASHEAFRLGGLEVPLFDARLLPQRIAAPALRSDTARGRSYVMYEAAASGGPLPARVFAQWYRLHDPASEWRRVLGVEGRLIFPAMAFVALPNVQARYGLAYVVDQPRERWQAFGSVNFWP
ncbi:MAG: TolB family protein [Gemmatimonadaceae bacterium]